MFATVQLFIKDNVLLSKLVRGDMIATEAKYHPTCLLALYDKASRVVLEKQMASSDNSVANISDLNAESLALAEVIAFIEETKNSELSPTVFKLSDLSELYYRQLEQYNVKHENRTNTTRLKQRLLDNLTNLAAVNQGCDVFLTFNEHLGIAVHQLKNNADADAVHLMHTAKIIRQEIFNCTSTFDGSFEPSCQANSVPNTLLTLVNMLLEGSGTQKTADNQSALSISQLIVFNAVKAPRKLTSDACENTAVVRHPVSQETPLPLYIGLMLHSATRKKRLVDKL